VPAVGSRGRLRFLELQIRLRLAPRVERPSPPPNLSLCYALRSSAGRQLQPARLHKGLVPGGGSRRFVGLKDIPLAEELS
jgi:hypothetical protein